MIAVARWTVRVREIEEVVRRRKPRSKGRRNKDVYGGVRCPVLTRQNPQSLRFGVC
jgi:hypothetical protein